MLIARSVSALLIATTTVSAQMAPVSVKIVGQARNVPHTRPSLARKIAVATVPVATVFVNAKKAFPAKTARLDFARRARTRRPNALVRNTANATRRLASATVKRAGPVLRAPSNDAPRTAVGTASVTMVSACATTGLTAMLVNTRSVAALMIAVATVNALTARAIARHGGSKMIAPRRCAVESASTAANASPATAFASPDSVGNSATRRSFHARRDAVVTVPVMTFLASAKTALRRGLVVPVRNFHARSSMIAMDTVFAAMEHARAWTSGKAMPAKPRHAQATELATATVAVWRPRPLASVV